MGDADFALETCYYGSGLHSRPGTLLLTPSVLIHSSYSWRQTLWAIGEPRIRIEVQLSDVVEVRRCPLSALLGLVQLCPESHFRVLERGGRVHDLILQRGSSDFTAALTKHKIRLTDERPSA